MTHELDVLQQVEDASGKNDKLAILKANLTNSNLKELLEAALSYKVKYYINKFEEYSTVGPERDLHKAFLGLLEHLNKRTSTGHAAIAAVEGLLKQCSPRQTKWYSRVLRRDLKMGAGIDTCVSAGFKLPVFDVMLAKDGGACKKLDQILASSPYASRKIDGYRCIAIVDNGEVTLFSREGEEYHNFPTIKQTIAELFPNNSFVLDGEIMSDNFNSMQKSAFASKRGTSVGDVFYALFDFISFEEWHSDNFKTNFDARFEALQVIFEEVKTQNKTDLIKLVEQIPVSSREQIAELQFKFESEGYEGLMLKPNIPYYRGKVSNKMLKFKSLKSMEATITGCYKGDPNSKYKDTLGGFHVIQENGALCDVGGGFTDKERDSIWKDQGSVIGRLIEVEYQELTPKNVMRFPVFVRYRDKGQGKGKI